MKFEYKIQKYGAKGGSLTNVRIDLDAMQLEFNQLGNEGWELVSVTSTNIDGGKTNWVWATFKRPKD